jgi:hypothetical protein
MRNIWNEEEGSRKCATTSNMKRSAIGSKNINRKRKRSKRRESGRIRGHVKRSSRIKNHEDVPDCVEVPVREAVVPVEEEPEEARRC